MIVWSLAHGIDLATLSSAIGQWFIKATAVLLVALLLDRLLRGRFVLSCAAMWNAALLLLAALPIAALLLPIWRFAVAPPVEIVAAPAAAPTAAPSDPPPVSPQFSPQPIAVQPTRVDHVVNEINAAAPATPTPQIAAPVSPEPALVASRFQLSDLLGPLLVAIYGLGCGIALVRLLFSLRGVVRLRRLSTAVDDPAWQQSLAHWRERCGLEQAIELRQSSAAEVPLLLGWRRPLIVLPLEVTACSDERTRSAILIHELAHVARSDFAWQLFLRGVRAMLWFHPLMWWAERRIGFVRERACDAYTVHRLGGAVDYVATLLEMAGRLTRRGSLSLGLAVLRSSQLGERLAAMRESNGSPRCQASRTTRLVTLVTALVLAGWGGRVAVGEPLLPRVEGLPNEAQTMVSQFEAESNRLRKEADRQIAERRAKLEQSLKTLQDDFTRQAKLDDAVAVRDQIRLLKALGLFGDRPPTIFKDPGNMVGFRSAIGQTFYVNVTGSTQGSLWGSIEYTDDSNLATTAVHAGVLKPNQTSIVKVTMLPSRRTYLGTQQNGVTSSSFSNENGNYSTFKVERAPDEIIALGKTVVPVEPPSVSGGYGGMPLTTGGMLAVDLRTGDMAIADRAVSPYINPLMQPYVSNVTNVRVDFAQAELQQAEMKVQNAKASQQLAATAVLRAEANLKRCVAEREFREKRHQRLNLLSKQSGAVDQDTVDESVFQLKSAQAAEELARLDLTPAQAQADSVTEQLRQAEAELEAARAKVEAARAQQGASQAPAAPGDPVSSNSLPISNALNFIARTQTAIPNPPPSNIMLQAPRNLSSFRQNVGQSYLFSLPSAAAPLSITQRVNSLTREVISSFDGSVWGSDIYTDDSALDVAAVHAGLLMPGLPTVVRVTILPGQPSYQGSSRNGVTSSSYSAWGGSYRIEKPTAEDFRRLNAVPNDTQLRIGRDDGLPADPVGVVQSTSSWTIESKPARHTTSQQPVQREFTPFEDFTGRLVSLDNLTAERIPAKSIAVHFNMDERSFRRHQELLRAGKVKGLGDPFSAALADEKGFPRAGTLDHFENEFDPNTGTIGVFGVLPNPDGLLLPGMFVRVRMAFGPPISVLEVPAEAVHREQPKGSPTAERQTYVWVVNDQGIVQRRLVRLGATDVEGRMRIIEDGLTPQDMVVVEGTEGLKPGDNIGPPPAEPRSQTGNR